ncbi:universal stress protein [Desulfitibacter alkalitolerans]|uniref:universal stress protein n=1 Tax=Desulfitibacter alkalitolerans TaxID=264641 RepID=UPI000489984F|nr:universal stress protein [Desulfitibacter alkalitolerans]
MFKKVLVCTDLSQASNALVSCVGDLKSLGVEEVVLANIRPIIALPGPGFNAVDKSLVENNPSLMEQLLVFQEAGINAITVSTTGIPARKINQLAEKHQVSAIVIGSHGKGIYEKAALGSVSSEVISLSKKPVFLVRLNADEDGNKVELACKSSFNHVIYLTDFSETADKALKYLETIIEKTKCPVTIVHVNELAKFKRYILESAREIPAVLFDDIEASWDIEIKGKLETVKSRLEKAGSHNVQIKIPVGRPIEIILDMIQNNKTYSLVIMGSQGKGFVKELFLGSLSLQVARYSPIPVLLIPAKFKE